MMRERAAAQKALFYGLSLERHVRADYLLRSSDRFADARDGATGVRTGSTIRECLGKAT